MVSLAIPAGVLTLILRAHHSTVADAASNGPLVTPEKARIGQALKIMKAAIGAMETNPRQALRALRAQADELQQAATATGDVSLAETARAMRDYLEAAERTGRFSGRQFATDIGEMFAMSPRPVLPKKSLLPLAG